MIPPQDRTGPYATGRTHTHYQVEQEVDAMLDPLTERAWKNGFVVGALAMGLAWVLGGLAVVLVLR